MIFLDSNVLVYAVGRDHHLQASAVDLVGVADGHPLRVTPRVLEEFVHVYARGGRTRTHAVELAGEWAASFGPVEHPSEEDVAMAFDLWAAHGALQVADALLAATAIRLEAQLISADRGYADVPGLDWIDLADPDLLERINAQT